MKSPLCGVAPFATRTLWLTVGLFSLALGALGAVLPVLPTTPFVILAACAFGKSSRRLQAALEANRVFGPAIRDWRRDGAIATRFKIVALLMMAAVLALSLVLSAPLAVIAVQAFCMSAAAFFIVTRPGVPA